ncbi:alpha/beta fold hydrolase [Streptomyces sp. NPDC088794]|uniref:alpha/beta fold hydrolase n=1 Tax=Streptomyces sp. NPDC088794 TaxID=3365902 RepID=UPI003823A614
MELAYTEIGVGEPLVLIMGLGAPGTAWEPHTAAWSRSFRCLAADNRGAGKSPAPPGPYTTAAMADDYADLIKGQELGPARVVGISMGGAIAQELALRHPELVSRLVLVASWARCDPHTAEIFRTLPLIWDRQEVATALLQWLIWTPGWFAAHEDELLAERTAPGRMSCSAFGAHAAACVSHDALDRLGGIRAPTLVTAGDADLFVPPRLSRELAEAVPGATLEIFSGAGHTHHWEQLDRFNTIVEAWLLGEERPL